MKNILEEINYPELRAQKESLLNMAEFCQNVEDFDKGGTDNNSIQGIINLIDAIQDNAVDVLGKDEKEVFGFTFKTKLYQEVQDAVSANRDLSERELNRAELQSITTEVTTRIYNFLEGEAQDAEHVFNSDLEHDSKQVVVIKR